jgi:Flp pilus assembly protein TadG
VSSVEFSLVAVPFIMFVILIAQLGLYFLANAGLNSALSEGARLATLYPRPTAAQIRSKIDGAKFGLVSNKLSTPTIAYGTAGSNEYATITMRYQMHLNFVFFHMPAVTLQQSRRVYLQPLPHV